MRASIYSTSELHLSGSLDLNLSAASVTKISAFEPFRYCTTSFKVFVNGGDGIFRGSGCPGGSGSGRHLCKKSFEQIEI